MRGSGDRSNPSMPVRNVSNPYAWWVGVAEAPFFGSSFLHLWYWSPPKVASRTAILSTAGGSIGATAQDLYGVPRWFGVQGLRFREDNGA